MRKKAELPDVEPVRLKSINGIRPGIFILAGIVVCIILLFFILFVLPGLISGTGFIRFNTNTVNTAIYTDEGKLIGSSEGSMYRLGSGEYTFVFFVDGVEAGRVQATVPHRIFFTLFRHKTDTVDFEAENTPEIENAVRNTFAEGVAAWSAVIDYDDSYHFPPLFSSFAKNATALSFSDVSDIFLYGAMHITSEAMYDDYLEALGILSESGISFSSQELDDLNGYLSLIYGDGSRKERESTQKNTEGIYANGFFTYADGEIEMGHSSSLSYPEINESPVKVAVPGFSISEHTVTEYEYALFVESVPYWGKGNIDTLIEDGMVDEGYLDGIILSSAIMSNKPIRNISYNAAVAYCEWLSGMTGMEYSLPSEGEWYTAALSASDKTFSASLIHADFDDSSPSAMMGGLWEMTDTPYIPLMRLEYSKALELGGIYPYDGIIVKGGSYINAKDGITIDSVGVVNRNQTSPFMGFRVVRK